MLPFDERPCLEAVSGHRVDETPGRHTVNSPQLRACDQEVSRGLERHTVYVSHGDSLGVCTIRRGRCLAACDPFQPPVLGDAYDVPGPGIGVIHGAIRSTRDGVRVHVGVQKPINAAPIAAR